MAKKHYIEIQNGPIEVGIPTYRTQTREQKVAEKVEENKMRRGYEREHLHEPKR